MRAGDDLMPRPAGCQCHLEIGDSPCRVHDADERLPAGTHPLPYVQVGMLLRRESDASRTWRVEDIYEDFLGQTIVVLREPETRDVIERVNTRVRAEWMLAADFDPCAMEEP